jgi:hypothetical protein
VDHGHARHPVDRDGRGLLRRRVGGIALLLVTWDAGASPVAVLDARFRDDGRTIDGTLELRDGDGLVVEGALDRLPFDVDDRFWLRTFPGRRDRGDIELRAVGPGAWAFTTRLPRRYEDVGATFRGAFANGWWHPVVLDVDGAPAPIVWEVTLSAPDDRLVVVGGAWGPGEARAEVHGERVSVAAVPDAAVTPVAPGFTLVTRGAPSPAWVSELGRVVRAVDSPAGGWRGVVVEAPLRRRLSRPGLGVAYLSDRAFRLVRPLRRYHRVGVARGVLTALVPSPDPFVRDVGGAAWTRAFVDDLRGPPARRVLKWLSWTPTIDFVLNDGTLPFHADVFEAAFPSDPLADDVVEALDPHLPGTAVVAQLEDASPGVAGPVAAAAVAGADRAGLAAAAGIQVEALDAYDAAPPIEDWVLDVGDTGVVVTRDAPPDAMPETLVVAVDGDRRVIAIPAGSGEFRVADTRPGRVVVDPGRHTHPTSRLGDSWPQRFVVTASAAIETINLSEGWVSARANLTRRRSGSNRESVGLGLGTSRDTVLASTASWSWRFGPQQTGLSRAHRLQVAATGAWMNGRFAEPDDPPGTIGAGVSWSWQNQPPVLFPLRGWRLAARVGGGSAIGEFLPWYGATGSVTRYLSPHPRVVVAARAAAGWTESQLRSRLLSLGGPGLLRSVPYGDVFGTTRALAAAELRVVPIRDASVPLGVMWASELQLTAGAEWGYLATPDGPVQAFGATFGAAGLADVLGADPYLLGVTVGVPVWTHGVVGSGPSVYVRWAQEF